MCLSGVCFVVVCSMLLKLGDCGLSPLFWLPYWPNPVPEARWRIFPEVSDIVGNLWFLYCFPWLFYSGPRSAHHVYVIRTLLTHAHCSSQHLQDILRISIYTYIVYLYGHSYTCGFVVVHCCFVQLKMNSRFYSHGILLVICLIWILG